MECLRLTKSTTLLASGDGNSRLAWKQLSTENGIREVRICLKPALFYSSASANEDDTGMSYGTQTKLLLNFRSAIVFAGCRRLKGMPTDKELTGGSLSSCRA